MNYREVFEAMLAGHIIQKDYSDGFACQRRMDANGNWMQRHRPSCDEPWSVWSLVGPDTGPNARVIKQRTRDDVACEPVVGDVVGGRTVNAVTPEGVMYLRYGTERVGSLTRDMWREYVRSINEAFVAPVQEGGE
jgi:hypothetical protein